MKIFISSVTNGVFLFGIFLAAIVLLLAIVLGPGIIADETNNSWWNLLYIPHVLAFFYGIGK